MEDTQYRETRREGNLTRQSSSVGLIIRQKLPSNLETPFDQLDSFITPVELFYIRSHFPTPKIELASYRLRIDGAVSRPLSLSYQELRDMPAKTQVALLECAGNSRVFLVPQVEGAQWELGAVGNAEWTGVSLRVLLEQAGVADDVCEIVLEGADRGIPEEKPVPPGTIAFARSLPLGKAMRPEVLIAYQMNGRDLEPDHGYPVRAIVPGHYGMASVKWLVGIHAVQEPFQGYWQTSDYAYWDYAAGNPVRRALGEVKPKSEIARPRAYERVSPNQSYTAFGATWAGETVITWIEVSTDAGRTWADAEFIDDARQYAWRRWKFAWITPKEPGRYTLLARSRGADGSIQPEGHDENYASYVINHSLPIEVFVEDPARPSVYWKGTSRPTA